MKQDKLMDRKVGRKKWGKKKQTNKE